MGTEIARFAIDVGATGTEEVRSLDDELVSLRERLKADQAAVSELQTALRRLQGAGMSNTATFKDLRNQLQAKKASLGAAQEQYVKLGGTFGNVSKAAQASGANVGKGLGDLAEAAQGAGGPIGSVVGKLHSLKQFAGKGGAAGAVIALAAVCIALTAAAITSFVALAAFGLKAASAARSVSLLQEAAMGGAVAGAALGGVISVIATRVALTREQLNEMALSLARSGLTGKTLEAAFSASATAAATMGDAAASAIQGIAERSRVAKRFILGMFDLQGTGVKLADVAQALATKMKISISAATQAIRDGRVSLETGLTALDNAVQKKLGDVAKRQLLAFDFQIKRAGENASRLFADVKIAPFLSALSDVLALLDDSTVSGQGLKAIMTGMLSAFFGDIAKGGPTVKKFFQGIIIGALMLTVMFLKMRNAVKDAFGGIGSSLDPVQVGIYALVAVAGLFGAALLVLGGMLASIAATVGMIIAPFLALGFAIGYVGSLIVSAFASAWAFLFSLDFGAIAKNLINSIVNGIKSGVGFVVEAAKNLGKSLLSGVKGALGIASPSKAMRQFGRFSGEGLELGMSDTNDDVQSAANDMMSIPDKAAKKHTSIPSKKQSQHQGQTTYQFGERCIVIEGVKDADELLSSDFINKLAMAFAHMVVQAGGRR